jgi:molecular chaperone HscC
VLKSLKADAEAFLGEKVTEAVITVPAYFNDKQRKATRRAGEMAGLKVERLLNEPTAAALAYGIHELADESQFLVFDLGGGTFDVSILEIFEGVIEVRASTGDNRLGGEDFNSVLEEMMAARFQAEWGGDLRHSIDLRERVRAAAERARRALTDASAATMSVVWNDKAYDFEVTAEAFETASERLLARLREPVLRSLRDSGIRVAELKEIVLVGGATRMPAVRKTVTRMVGRVPSATVNPAEAVAIGAAIQAGLKARDVALKEVVLTDVCPYSLGVDVAERLPTGALRHGLFSPIIERNTVVPASRAKSFSTLEAGQRKVVFNIYQGESRDVSENVHLGRIEVPVPAREAGHVSVDCRFSYDINGLLEVDVAVPETGLSQQLVIIDDTEVDPAELERRRIALAELKQHPRDQDANRALMARAARCYEAMLGERREYVGRATAAFEAVVEQQDPRDIEQARKALTAVLDDFEGETFF